MVRRKRPLSEDDSKLWKRVTDKVEPLHPDRPPGTPPPLKPKKRSTAPAPQPEKPPLKPFRIGEKAASPKARPHAAVEDQTPGVSPNMDRRNFQRLLRGQIEIDATLDLHGMTAEMARHRLVVFLQQAHARGARLVLVITGKGKKTHIDEFNRPRSGILRESLPDWLRGPALSALVLQVTHAQPKHGGKGAFYVYLRRKR